jgi:hypothetical protein
MHAAINNTKDIVPAVAQTGGNPFALNTAPLTWINVGLLWITAAYFLARMSSSGRGTERALVPRLTRAFA